MPLLLLPSQALTARPGEKPPLASPMAFLIVCEVEKLPPPPTPTSHFCARATGAVASSVTNVMDRKCFIVYPLLIDNAHVQSSGGAPLTDDEGLKPNRDVAWD